MNANAIQIETLCKWGEPKAVNTKNGPRILRVATPTEEFWRAKKSVTADEWRASGLGCGKNPRTGQREATWWQNDPERAVAQEKAIEESRAAEPMAEYAIPAPEGLDYLPYQKAGIGYALGRTGTLIGDEMGLGKTIQALGVINADPSIQKVLVICPASLKLNWEREARKWLIREFDYFRVKGRARPGESELAWEIQRDRPFFAICNYDVAASWFGLLHGGEWDLVIMDEAHYLKNPKAQRTIACLGKYAKVDPKFGVRGRRKIILTGTPILNRPIEAQPLLGYLEPREFGNYFKFGLRYANGHQTPAGKRMVWDFTGASHLDELQRRLRATCMVRRLKRDVLTELPAKRRQVIEIPANGAQSAVDEENEAYEEHKATLETLQMRIEEARLLDDQNAYNEAVNQLREAMKIAFEQMAAARKRVALDKVPYVVEHVASCAMEAPVVLFAWHREVVEQLMTGLTGEGLKCVKVIGGMSDEQKQESVDAFQGGKADVFIGNIKAAGVGLTLVRSSHVVFAELDWTPANVSQAEDRTHRIGQTNSVLVQHLVLEGSLDQRMAKAIVRKQNIADAALDKALAKVEVLAPVTWLTMAKDAPVEIEKPARVYSPEEVDRYHKGVQRIAGMCDGARELDDYGFNKFDARYGHLLAHLPALTQTQAAVAEKLCRKYRRQLGWEDLYEPKKK